MNTNTKNKSAPRLPPEIIAQIIRNVLALDAKGAATWPIYNDTIDEHHPMYNYRETALGLASVSPFFRREVRKKNRENSKAAKEMASLVRTRSREYLEAKRKGGDRRSDEWVLKDGCWPDYIKDALWVSQHVKLTGSLLR